MRDLRQWVIQDVRDILPDREALHVRDITLWIGADLMQEAEEQLQAWSVDTVRESIGEQMYWKQYLVGEGADASGSAAGDGGVAACHLSSTCSDPEATLYGAATTGNSARLVMEQG